MTTQVEPRRINPKVRHMTPPVNITETGEAVTIEAEMPGVRQDDVQVEVENGILTVRAHRNGATPGAKVHYRERINGEYARSFRIGKHIDPDAITARLNNGILEITLGKQAAAQRRQVTIN